ncbi:MAG: peptide chain release factor N(5)-glutamine methyltransferase [Alphaproteobacteria bacterium]
MSVTVDDLRAEIARRLGRAFAEDERREATGLDARIIVAHVTGSDPDRLVLDGGRVVTPQAAAQARELGTRRAAGEPVARLVGHQAFYGLDLAVSPATLIPRPDTETLVDVALAAVDCRFGRNHALRVLDLGTGAGGIVLALASSLPKMFGVGVDRAPEAAATATANAERLGLGDRVRFVTGDWDAAIDGSFDLVVSNPPYVRRVEIAGLAVEVRDHEPDMALDGGADGQVAYRALLPKLDRLLAPKGVALLEIGHDQAAAVTALAAGLQLTSVVSRDLGGRDRVIELVRDIEQH